jgi:hypothetical protein
MRNLTIVPLRQRGQEVYVDRERKALDLRRGRATSGGSRRCGPPDGGRTPTGQRPRRRGRPRTATTAWAGPAYAGRARRLTRALRDARRTGRRGGVAPTTIGSTPSRRIARAAHPSPESGPPAASTTASCSPQLQARITARRREASVTNVVTDTSWSSSATPWVSSRSAAACTSCWSVGTLIGASIAPAGA